jgi:hypothetical protein
MALKRFLVAAKCEVIKEFVVTARNEEEARKKFELLDDSEDIGDNELRDWELLTIEENV